MTHQRELDRILDAFLAEGHDELADRVIDAALDQIDDTPQRRAMRLPRRFQAMPMLTRVAAAAVIGVIAVGGTLYVLKPGQSSVGGPGVSSGPSQPTQAPTASPVPTLVPTPTAKPSPMALTGVIGAGRQIQTQTTLADGRVLIAGGFDWADLPLASATLFDPKTGTFTATGSMAAARGYQTATLLADGRVLITGGGPAAWVHPGPFLASAELYDPKTGTFTPTGSMTTTREYHTATLLRDGRVLIVGGDAVPDTAVALAELYDPKTGTFARTGSMATARGFHTATLLADGRVLIAGGEPAGFTSVRSFSSAEIYDPKTGKFSPTGSMATGRGAHAATLLADGRVLVTGGVGDNGTELGSAEIFDPKSGTFASAGSMTISRVYQTATLLADGRVLIVGGGGDYANRNFLASAEIFDPATGTFTLTGSLAEARSYHGATLLPDGRVLVTGGYGDVAPLASAEIYDPKTASFSPAGAGS